MDWLPRRRPHRHRAPRKRGITLSNQQYDGMSRLSDPQARATFEAVLAKTGRPGATNPDDHTPVIDTTPDAAAIITRHHGQAQRNHDGLLAGLRALIASGNWANTAVFRLDRGHHHPDRPASRRRQGASPAAAPCYSV